jgi:hypothetical protein
VGQHYIEVGTVIEADLLNPITGLPLPLPLPMNARALDQEAWALLKQWYAPNLWRLLSYDPHSVTP